MRRFAAVILATTLVASSALAAGTDSASPLAPGKPAGVQQATLAGTGLLFFFGLAVIGGGIALVSTQGSSGNKISATTTGTAP
jgi:hypothetical protein